MKRLRRYSTSLSSRRRKLAYFEFLWTEAVVAKLAPRDLTTEDVEDIVCHPLDVVVSRSSGLPAAVGYADNDCLLFVVYSAIDEMLAQAVTAYEIEK